LILRTHRAGVRNGSWSFPLPHLRFFFPEPLKAREGRSRRFSFSSFCASCRHPSVVPSFFSYAPLRLAVVRISIFRPKLVVSAIPCLPASARERALPRCSILSRALTVVGLLLAHYVSQERCPPFSCLLRSDWRVRFGVIACVAAFGDPRHSAPPRHLHRPYARSSQRSPPWLISSAAFGSPRVARPMFLRETFFFLEIFSFNGFFAGSERICRFPFPFPLALCSFLDASDLSLYCCVDRHRDDLQRRSPISPPEFPP